MSASMGMLLKQQRTKAGLSQNALAKRAGVDVAHLFRLERGTSEAGPAVLGALARSMGLPAVERDRLMVAAGYWPWGSADAATLDAVLTVGRALVDRGGAPAMERTA